MSHPRDSEAWIDFNLKYPSFSAEIRNIRLALASDGFSPFNVAIVEVYGQLFYCAITFILD